jgi:hypothetical protein
MFRRILNQRESDFRACGGVGRGVMAMPTPEGLALYSRQPLPFRLVCVPVEDMSEVPPLPGRARPPGRPNPGISPCSPPPGPPTP